MSAEARYFRVGLFVLIGIVLIGACTVILGGQNLFKEPVLMETVFNESVQGLEVGSPVKLRGVQLGTVSEIAFVRDYYPVESTGELREHGEKIVVLMEVMEPVETEISSEERRENVKQLIGRGLRLRLASSGVTGTVFVQGDFLSPTRHPPMEIPWTPENLYIPSAPSTMATITSAAERIFAQAARRPAFGNARFARSLFEQAYARMAVRAAADGTVEVEELMELHPDDLEATDSGPTSTHRPIGFGGES